ncbi:MAG TPA: PEGA domain-containing protein [Vicinamibacterales bacterium]
MNRTVLVAGALAVVVVIGAVVFMRGGDPEPPPATNTSSGPPAPRVVPKKVDSAPVAETPRKTPAKKAEPKPVEETPAPTAPTLASLSLDSDVPGASVFIDRQFVGNTPLKLDKLEPGTKRVQLTATGFDSVQRTIELAPGPNNITLRVKEVSLNARANVVHKHGMGSCEGTLTATLDGLRYVTSNKGDAFTLSYAQVETFAVDYLEKNLRVKQRGGRTWNFTDRNDNADTLFVFHRDVEAARKKLAAGYAPAQ